MDVTAALIVGLTLMGAKFFDWWASTQLARPIFCVAILGALLGHPPRALSSQPSSSLSLSAT